MVFKKIKSKSNHYVLAVIPFFLMICACGGGEGSSSDAGSGEGTLSFQLVWENRPDLNASQAAPSGDVCDDYNIQTVAITVRDSSNVEVASANPFCDLHESTIGVPVGSDITVNVAGMVAGNADWQGQATGITVNKDQDTNLTAIIEMNYIGNDITPPTVLNNHFPALGAAGVALNPNITATFSEDVVAASVELETLSSCTVFETVSGVMVGASVQYDSETTEVTIVPDMLSPDTEYTVTITTDIEDLAGWHMESDYSWSFTTVSPTGLPDLIVRSLSVTSYTTDSISYSYTIENVGTAPANLDGPTGENHDNVDIQAFLSADTTFNNSGDIAAGGTILGSSPLGELAPGETFSGTFSASATVNTSATPYLTLMVDWGEVVEESDETNNTAAAQIASDTGSPDLIVRSFRITSQTSSSIEYSYTIENVGTAPANLDGPTGEDHDNVSIQAIHSADTIYGNSGDIAAGGAILGSSPLGELAPGETYIGSYRANAADDTTATPYLMVTIDSRDVVDESDETNNTAYAIIDPGTGSPDLIVRSLSVTSFTSSTIYYSYTIENIGTASANLDGPTDVNYDNVSVQAYLSADTVFNNSGDVAAGGTILGSSPLGELAPGETFSGSFGAGAVVDTSATPYLTLIVDWGDVVDESDETNNTIATQIVSDTTVVVDLDAD